MHPREFFWFRSKSYQKSVNSRDAIQLSADASHKKNKMEGNKTRFTVLILVIVITHGLLLPLVLVYFRSMSVAKRKIRVIQGELRQRKLTEYASDLQEIERLNGKPLSTSEVDALLQMFDAAETEQDDLHEHISSYAEISRDAPPAYELEEPKPA